MFLIQLINHEWSTVHCIFLYLYNLVVGETNVLRLTNLNLFKINSVRVYLPWRINSSTLTPRNIHFELLCAVPTNLWDRVAQWVAELKAKCFNKDHQYQIESHRYPLAFVLYHHPGHDEKALGQNYDQ